MNNTREYKELSKVSWLGSIPAEWDAKKIGSLFSQRKTKVSDKDFPPLSVSKAGVVPQLSTALKTNDGDNRKLVRAGDFVINSRSDRKGSCGIAKEDGSVSLINIVLTPRGNWDERYIHYLLRSQPFSEEYYRYGRGIVADLWTTRYSEMKNIVLPIPSIDEQKKIGQYLDWQVSKINKLISSMKTQISLLKEQEHVALRRIVFEGIDRHSEGVQKTGLPWIEEVPASWKRLRIKNLLQSKKQIVGEDSSKHVLLSLTTGGIIERDVESGKGKFPSDFSSYQLVDKGDFVFCLFDVDETPRTVGLSNLNGMITGAYDVFTINFRNPAYLFYYFLCIDDEKALKPYYSGLRKVVKQDVFLRLPIFIPSDDEQDEIVKRADAIIQSSKKAQDILNNEIEALNELRSRLVADVVLGRKNVLEIEIPDYEYVDDESCLDADDDSEGIEEQED